MVSCNSQDLFRKMAFHFNVSLTAINLAKSVTHNANMLERRVRHSSRHDYN